MNENDELLEVFKAEVSEQLVQLDEQLSLAPSRWDPDQLFHLSHNVKGAGRMIGAAEFTQLAHGLEDIFSLLRAGGATASTELAALAREGTARLQACLDGMDQGTVVEVDDYVERVAGVLAIVDEPSDEQNPTTGKHEAPADAQPAATATPHPRKQKHPGADRRRNGSAGAGSTIRIGLDKLQSMMGLAAELSTSVHRAELRRVAALRIVTDLAELRRAKPHLVRDDMFQRVLQSSRELLSGLAQDGALNQQLSEQLQDGIRQMRMVRIDTLSSLLRRAVRHAGEAMGREVEFHTEGGDTEIDRAILDRLHDPLVHLVRNAVTHGIESPEERKAAGKQATGVVTLWCRSAGSWVELVVEDDGSGVDVEQVRKKAVEDGVLAAKNAASLGNEDVMDLLFRPGFSTARAVSELAGRGVGMDIVRTNLVQIGGSVTIASTDGKGTRVRLRAPLTRLTIRGLVVQAGGLSMAFPMIGVDRTVMVGRGDVHTVDAIEVITVDDVLVPIDELGRALGFAASESADRPAVVLSEGHRRRAFLVEEIVGEKEFTIQALPWNLEYVWAVAGAAVLESGEVLLMLNSHELLGAKGGTLMGAGHADAAKDARQFRVLVVDDSVTSRTLEKNILASAGYDVLLSVNGKAALDTLAEREVDLVVTDVDMPAMNGIELTRAIRASPEMEDLPVILVTSLGSDEDKRRGADAGANAYIVKGTFDQDELLKAVARLL